MVPSDPTNTAVSETFGDLNLKDNCFTITKKNKAKSIFIHMWLISTEF